MDCVVVLLGVLGVCLALFAAAVVAVRDDDLLVPAERDRADLGLPDIGLTTLSEVAGRAGQIARATDLPVLVDADTGFGEPMSAARTVSELEDAGVAGRT